VAPWRPLPCRDRGTHHHPGPLGGGRPNPFHWGIGPRAVQVYPRPVARPQPGDPNASAFVAEVGHCWRMVHGHKGQAAHCAQPTTFTGRWYSPRDDGTYCGSGPVLSTLREWWRSRSSAGRDLPNSFERATRGYVESCVSDVHDDRRVADSRTPSAWLRCLYWG
jgi:hypothetical protein